MGIALEEAEESAFWLEILIEGQIVTPGPEVRRLLDEADQLTAILAQSKLTATQNAAARAAEHGKRSKHRHESVTILKL